jgi:transcriptional regulator with XRE-family HTH domain
MKDLLKSGRENKNLKTRQLSELAAIDQALISKFESGKRIPTENQVRVLAQILEINLDLLLVAWYKSRLESNLDFNTNSIKAIIEIFKEKGLSLSQNEEKENKIAEILSEIDNLKNRLNNI